MTPKGIPSPLDFFGHLVWLDGRPLLDTIEPYRRDIFMSTLYSFGPDGHLIYNMALCGRGKKNWKTADLILAALYRLLVWPSAQGNDGFILANDEDQAGDDLSLGKKLIAVNPPLSTAATVGAKAITRRDGRGALHILPARDAIGAHGKTALFLGFDEIHGYRTHDLFEALAPDPTRPDVMTWITSYAGIRHAPGIPLYDFMQTGKRGDDPRMFFSWYSGDFTTDPAAAELPPEQRANPSMASWNNPGYLPQQRKRLPTHKYRRLHLNLPGAPDGAAFSVDSVMESIVTGRKRLPPTPGLRYHAFVDMSGGSNDDAVLGIAHRDSTTKQSVLDLLISQIGKPPFNPRTAVAKFADLIKEYGLSRVTGDAYAGETFRADFAGLGISYNVAGTPKTEFYEGLEPKLNAGEVELLDLPELQEQMLTLVWRGTRIDHQPGDHDDYANAAAGALLLTTINAGFVITDEILARSKKLVSPHWRHRVNAGPFGVG
ncbi:MAG: hypothetical protein QOJ15_3177 [Bradyrhizobium sp.]|jgi:hypothetical protein|nr:hypothetical protein [Bradyrhizobium sp.]